jgi:hypothetical protein
MVSTGKLLIPRETDESDVTVYLSQKIDHHAKETVDIWSLYCRKAGIAQSV